MIIKPIEGFGEYFISDNGKVLSMKNGFRWLKIRNGVNGYLVVCLTGEKALEKKVHRLVAQAFVPIPSKYADMSIDELDVHHINFDNKDNRPENLMWLTKAEHKKLHSESEVTKQRLSAANKGEKNSMYGKHHSEECRRKISEALKGRKMSDSFKEECRHRMKKRGKPDNFGKKPKAVEQYTKEGDFVTTYPSTREAERQTGIDHSQIAACCNGKEKYMTAGGYKWKFV